MNTEQTLEIKSSSSRQTEKIGQLLSKVIRPGDTLQLVSDLGGGKTTLTKGIVSGLGYSGEVSSPTFTILGQYKTESDQVIYHYDFYRLSDPGIVKQELAETLADQTAINIIEWADIVSDILPKDTFIIKLDFVAADQNYRTIKITAPSTVVNQLKELL